MKSTPVYILHLVLIEVLQITHKIVYYTFTCLYNRSLLSQLIWKSNCLAHVGWVGDNQFINSTHFKSSQIWANPLGMGILFCKTRKEIVCRYLLISKNSYNSHLSHKPQLSSEYSKSKCWLKQEKGIKNYIYYFTILRNPIYKKQTRTKWIPIKTNTKIKASVQQRERGTKKLQPKHQKLAMRIPIRRRATEPVQD